MRRTVLERHLTSADKVDFRVRDYPELYYWIDYGYDTLFIHKARDGYFVCGHCSFLDSVDTMTGWNVYFKYSLNSDGFYMAVSSFQSAARSLVGRDISLSVSTGYIP